MAKQIVTIGNRVVAHGEDCFLSMGGTVVCNETSKAYSSATVTEVEAIPADIDTVGYEYHAGVFVPCAPYGKGSGNLAVVCDGDCKTIKDSGFHLTDLLSTQATANEAKTEAENAQKTADGRAQIATGSYIGTGTGGSENPNSLTFDFAPKLVIIANNNQRSSIGSPILHCEALTTEYQQGYGFSSYGNISDCYAKRSEDGKTIWWYSTDENASLDQLNGSSGTAVYTYYWIAIG